MISSRAAFALKLDRHQVNKMSSSPSPAQFTSAHVRARIVKILLTVGAIAAGMSLLAEAFSLAFPPLGEGEDPGANPLGAVMTLITFLLALFEIIVYLATVVCFLMWLYRAYNNLRAFDSWSRPDYSAAMAVGSFFIPFANLVLPYRIVKEVWQKSGTADEGLMSEPNTPAFFPIWWLFWLLASFAGNISTRLSFEGKVDESTAAIVSVIAGGLAIIAAVFAYLVVDAIDAKQEETSGKLKLGKFSGPPPPPADLQMSNVEVI